MHILSDTEHVSSGFVSSRLVPLSYAYFQLPVGVTSRCLKIESRSAVKRTWTIILMVLTSDKCINHLHTIQPYEIRFMLNGIDRLNRTPYICTAALCSLLVKVFCV
jgi:hypothetical protein